ncbi:MAG TPA: signal peptidase I [Clostridiales bacterium]|jgi:signal peptidase I|nr:signal peptidase I [Clostridiales bacterium]
MEYRHVEFQKKEDETRYHVTAVWLYDVVATFVVAILLIGLTVCFLGKGARVSGRSMEPTLSSGDRLIITNLTNRYQRGDIVVIGRQPKQTLVKRIIATEGDTVDIDFSTGQVFLNGTLLEEDYIAEPTYLNYTDGPTFPLTVPTGYVFVLGDNRNHSLDSRSGEVGLVLTQSILGKVVWNAGHYSG